MLLLDIFLHFTRQAAKRVLAIQLRKPFLCEGVQLFEDLDQPGFSVNVENFFSAVVAPTREILPIVLADAGNLLQQTAHAIVRSGWVHFYFASW